MKNIISPQSENTPWAYKIRKVHENKNAIENLYN